MIANEYGNIIISFIFGKKLTNLSVHANTYAPNHFYFMEIYFALDSDQKCYPKSVQKNITHFCYISKAWIKVIKNLNCFIMLKQEREKKVRKVELHSRLGYQDASTAIVQPPEKPRRRPFTLCRYFLLFGFFPARLHD